MIGPMGQTTEAGISNRRPVWCSLQPRRSLLSIRRSLGESRAMNTFLVTGATGFLGYHVAKRLNEAGIRPRVLERPESRLEVLDGLDVERCAGHLDDPAAVRSACTRRRHSAPCRVQSEHWRRGGGCRGDAADQRRGDAVALAGGCRQRRAPRGRHGQRARHRCQSSAHSHSTSPRAGSNTDWICRTPLLRRQVELDALAQATSQFAVLTVCPAFTFGPDDPSGAPANKLLQALMAGKVPVKVAVGFGCLDVRDFARGMVLAGERGQSGQRYLLSGENVTTDQLLTRRGANHRCAPTAVHRACLPREGPRGRDRAFEQGPSNASTSHRRRAADSRTLRLVRHREGAHRAWAGHRDHCTTR